MQGGRRIAAQVSCNGVCPVDHCSHCWRDLPSQFFRAACGSGHALRALLEATAMRVGAWRFAGSHYNQNFGFCRANSWATRHFPAHLRLRAMMVSRVRGRFCNRRMHRLRVASMHGQHRSENHFAPSGHCHQQKRGDCPLNHPD